MASNGLRRLATRIARASAAPCTSDLIQLAGDSGDSGDSPENLGFFCHHDGRSRGDSGDKAPDVTAATNAESGVVTKKALKLADVTAATNVTAENNKGRSENATRRAVKTEPPAQPDEPGRFYANRARARWYEEQRIS